MFQKIDHINVSVKNINETVLWYGNVFGFKKVEEGSSLSGVKFVIIENKDTMLCIYEHPDWKASDLNGPTTQHQIFHIGFRITDEAKWRERIKEFDLTLSYGEINYPRSNSWYVLDPNGYEIEVSCLKEGVTMFGA